LTQPDSDLDYSEPQVFDYGLWRSAAAALAKVHDIDELKQRTSAMPGGWHGAKHD